MSDLQRRGSAVCSLLLGISVLLVGCASQGGGSAAPGGATASAPAPVPAPPQPIPGLSPQQRLQRSVFLLEYGRSDLARVEIEALLEGMPGSSLGRLLLRQIETPSTEYFPEDYAEVKLNAGESLSQVAEYYLGSGYEFYALAKYNGIDEPRRVFSGQALKIPLTPDAIAAFSRPQEMDDEVPTAAEQEAAEVGVALSERAGDSEPDRAPTPASVQEQHDAPKTRRGPVPQLVNDLEPEAALESESATAADVASTPDREQPVAAPSNALDRDEPAEAAVPEPSMSVSTADLDVMHREAIQAYRAQDLDGAIAKWNDILAIDPDYESARIYREQAMALKRRLERLQSSAR